jgi:putative chitinase
MTRITAEFLRACCPGAQVDLVATAKAINEFFPKYGIKSNREVRYYLAQCFQETDGLKTFREYATGEAYEGRGHLGNNQAGDGKLFRGRGLIMTTGRNNYSRLSAWLKKEGHWGFSYDLTDKPQSLEQPTYAVLAACFYFVDHSWAGQHIKMIIAGGNFENLTRAINGGLNGLQDRLTYLGKLNKLLGKNEIDWPLAPGTVFPGSPTSPPDVPPVPQDVPVGFLTALAQLIKQYFGKKS